MKLTWCSNCQRNVPTTPVTGTSDARCNRCNRTINKQFRLHDETSAGERPKKKKVRKKSVSAKDSRKPTTIRKPAPSNESHAESEFRFDQSHQGSAERCSDETRGVTKTKTNAAWWSKNLPGIPLHAAGFGIFLFLIGHIMMTWAFIKGAFTLWSIGNLTFATAMVLTLWSLLTNFAFYRRDTELLRRRLGRLERKLNQDNEPSPTPQKPRKIVVRSRAKKPKQTTRV